MKKPRGLKLRNGWWHIIVQVNGNRFRKALGLEKHQEKLAIEKTKEFWEGVAKGNIRFGRKNPSLASLFDNYVEGKGEAIKPKSKEQIIGCFERVKNELGWVWFDDFNTGDFNRWLKRMPTRRTAKGIQIEVRAAFSEAVADCLIEENPLRDIKLLQHTRRHHKPLRESEYLPFAKAISEYSCGNLVLFLMKTGCRFSEAAVAKWVQMDLDREVLVLDRDEDKEQRAKDVPIPTDICILLAEMRLNNPRSSDFVFVDENGEPFKADYVRRRVMKAGKSIGRPHTTTHALRHTFTKLTRDREDVTIDDVRATLGHSSTSTTQIYDHPNTERQRKIAEKLPSFLELIT